MRRKSNDYWATTTTAPSAHYEAESDTATQRGIDDAQAGRKMNLRGIPQMYRAFYTYAYKKYAA